MASKIPAFSLRHTPGSEQLEFLRGLEQISPDICRWGIIPFRTVDLALAAATQTDTKHLSSDFDFIQDSIFGRVEPLLTDTRVPNQAVFFNIRESGRQFDVLPDAVPMSVFGGSIGGGGAASIVESYSGLSGLQQKIPYVYSANTDIRVTWSLDAILGATWAVLPRVTELFLIGYFVRKDLTVATIDEIKALNK